MRARAALKYSGGYEETRITKACTSHIYLNKDENAYIIILVINSERKGDNLRHLGVNGKMIDY
jgi:RNA-binding protein YlmH